MKLQDLNREIQRLEAKLKENLLEQKVQLEKEYLVRRENLEKNFSFTKSFRTKSMN